MTTQSKVVTPGVSWLGGPECLGGGGRTRKGLNLIDMSDSSSRSDEIEKMTGAK